MAILATVPLPSCRRAPPAIHVAQQMIGPGIAAEARVSFVWHSAGRLEQEQAIVRIGEIQAPALGVARQGQIILGRIVTEQRESETAFALERAVAGAGIAAHAAKHAHDMALEIDFLDGLAARQRHGGAALGTAERASATRARWEAKRPMQEEGISRSSAEPDSPD